MPWMDLLIIDGNEAIFFWSPGVVKGGLWGGVDEWVGRWIGGWVGEWIGVGERVCKIYLILGLFWCCKGYL